MITVLFERNPVWVFQKKHWKTNCNCCISISPIYLVRNLVFTTLGRRRHLSTQRLSFSSLKKPFNRGDTKYHGGLRSRELCQAPIMQALSSHSQVCESELSSWNNFFQSCRGQGSNRRPSEAFILIQNVELKPARSLTCFPWLIFYLLEPERHANLRIPQHNFNYWSPNHIYLVRNSEAKLQMP